MTCDAIALPQVTQGSALAGRGRVAVEMEIAPRAARQVDQKKAILGMA
jgi:hypothetical protein